jgi:hypothetical protein
VTRTRQREAFTDLDDPEWLALVANVQESWFRLETLQVYSVDYERDEYERFLASGRLDRAPGEWQAMIRRHADASRSLRRVHIIGEPLTDYLRYELQVYRHNSTAGEEVRVIPTPVPNWPAGLPRGLDYWLFDDRAVWDMHYDDTGRFLRAARSTSASHLDECRQWRDSAIRQSISLSDYLRLGA